MSDDTLGRENNKQESKETPSTNSSNSKKKLFGNLNSDLRNALNTWETLTEETANKVSPEEEQLQEVKKLLGELKSKLKEFGD